MFDKHLVETDDLPLASLGVQRQISMMHLTLLDETGFDTSASNRASKMIVTVLDGEIGQRNLPGVARGDSRAS